MKPLNPVREFTGRHMLAAMLAFFGVIIAVNLTLATFAAKSWTGLVVKNSYVASQEFNERLAESRTQDALGWTSTLHIAGGRVTYALRDAAGKPVPASSASVTFRRPAYEAEDVTFPLLAGADATLSAEHTIRDGLWIVEIEADAGLPRPYKEARRITIVAGALQ